MFPDHPASRDETGDDGTDPVTVELYVRSLCSGPERPVQESAIERLEPLERDGVLEGYTVHVWGRRVSPESAAAETDTGEFVLSRIDEFRNCESYTAITVPTLTFAEFHGDDLHRVTPCSRHGTVHAVDDHLDALEATARTDGDGDGDGRDGFGAGRWPPGYLADAPISGSDGGTG